MSFPTLSKPPATPSQVLSRREWMILAAITIVTAVLRFYHLTALPHGLHGDEATAGLEAQRILREGYIGPYSQFALGQPTGPLYVDALPQLLLGNTVLAVRVVPAFLGTLCVPSLFFLVRRHLDFATAAISAGLLAVMDWHIHFSRVGFPLNSWPLCAVVAAAALLEAMRRDDWRWWCLAGAVGGVGIYSYNAHLLFLGLELAFLCAYLCGNRTVPGRTRRGWSAAFAAGLLLVAFPMVCFALVPANNYFGHAEFTSVFSQPEWREHAGIGERAWFLAGRYGSFWFARILRPETNWADGTGAVPLVPLPLAVLMAMGTVLGWRQRQPLIAFAICVLLTIPLAVVFTTQGGPRRTFAMAPFLAVLAAVGVVESYRRAATRDRRNTGMALALWCALFAGGQLYGYFVATAKSADVAWVYCADLEDAISFMKRQPPGAYFYFQSDRWSFNYEPRRYLAPEIHGQDLPFYPRHPERTYGVARPHAVFVLLGSFRLDLDELRLMYPGGRIEEGPPTIEDGRPSFVAYAVPDR